MISDALFEIVEQLNDSPDNTVSTLSDELESIKLYQEWPDYNKTYTEQERERIDSFKTMLEGSIKSGGKELERLVETANSLALDLAAFPSHI